MGTSDGTTAGQLNGNIPRIVQIRTITTGFLKRGIECMEIGCGREWKIRKIRKVSVACVKNVC